MTVIPHDFIPTLSFHSTIQRYFFQKFLLWVILKYLSVIMKTVVFCKNFIEGLFYLKPREFIVDFFTNNI